MDRSYRVAFTTSRNSGFFIHVISESNGGFLRPPSTLSMMCNLQERDENETLEHTMSALP